MFSENKFKEKLKMYETNYHDRIAERIRRAEETSYLSDRDVESIIQSAREEEKRLEMEELQLKIHKSYSINLRN